MRATWSRHVDCRARSPPGQGGKGSKKDVEVWAPKEGVIEAIYNIYQHMLHMLDLPLEPLSK